MAARRKPIQITDESDIRLLLRAAAAACGPVLVDTGDALYEIDVHPATSEAAAGPAEARRPSAEQVARLIAGIRDAAGGWQGLVDADELTACLYERRRIADRPHVSL